MAIPEAFSYLPVERGASNAFDEINRRHPRGATVDELKALSVEEIAPLAGDFVTASVAYFANHSDNPTFEDIGTTSWRAINQRRVLTTYAEDARAGAFQCGLPAEHAMRLLPGEPNFAIYQRKGSAPFGIIVIPPELIERARINPVEALAAMLSMLSQVRDMETGRSFEDPAMINQRAGAIEAQFVLDQQRLNPNLELSPVYQGVLAHFPEGINSLPESARY